jgi:hypothetical protein
VNSSFVLSCFGMWLGALAGLECSLGTEPVVGQQRMKVWPLNCDSSRVVMVVA